MADFYIDPSAATNGSGTQASPYNSFTELNAITGDQVGNRWFIKRGTTATQQISITGASNFTIDAYGNASDPLPIISGALKVTASNFTKDAIGWYYSTSKAVRVIATQESFKTNYTDFLYASVQGELATGFTWFDSANNRQYLADDPSQYSDLYVLGQLTGCIALTSCSGTVSIKNLMTVGGDQYNISVSGFGSGSLLMDGIETLYGGSYGATGTPGYSNMALYADGLSGGTARVARCYSYRSINTGLEWGDWTGDVTVENNTFKDNGNNIELYSGSSANNYIHGNTIDGVRDTRILTSHGNWMWVAAASLTGRVAAGTVEFVGNVCKGRVPKNGISVDAGATVRLWHNLLDYSEDIDNAFWFTVYVNNVDGNALAFDMRGNAIIAGRKRQYLLQTDTNAATTNTVDYNLYVSPSSREINSYQFNHSTGYGATTLTSAMADYANATSGLEQHSAAIGYLSTEELIRLLDVPKFWTDRIQAVDGAVPDFNAAPGANQLVAGSSGVLSKRKLSRYGTLQAWVDFRQFNEGTLASGPSYTPVDGSSISNHGSRVMPQGAVGSLVAPYTATGGSGTLPVYKSGQGIEVKQRGTYATALNIFSDHVRDSDYTFVQITTLLDFIQTASHSTILRQDLSGSPWTAFAFRHSYTNGQLQFNYSNTAGVQVNQIGDSNTLSLNIPYAFCVRLDSTATVMRARIYDMRDLSQVATFDSAAGFAEPTTVTKTTLKTSSDSANSSNAVLSYVHLVAVLYSFVSDTDLPNLCKDLYDFKRT